MYSDRVCARKRLWYSGNMEKIRIVLADDHDLVRSSLKASLKRFPDFAIIGEARDGQQALDLVGELKPDILICDIRMPGIDGIKVAFEIKKSSPGTRMLMLSAYGDDEYVAELIKAGVSGYMLKTSELGQVVEAIRVIHHGQTVFNPEINARLAALLPRSNQADWELLSPREFKIMELVSQGITSPVIAHDLEVSRRTVDTFVDRIRLKLGFKSRAAAVSQFLKDNPKRSGGTG